MSIVDNLVKDGYAPVPCAVDVLRHLIDLSARVHCLEKSKRSEIAADQLSGVLGYYPADNDEYVSVFPQFSGLRRRGYASFDYTGYEGCLGRSRVFAGNKMPIGDDRNISQIRQDIILAYDILSKLSHRVASILSREFGGDLPLHKLEFEQCNPTYALLRLLKYNNAAAVSKAHTDYEYITLIITEQEGLEVQNDYGDWIKVQNDGPQCIAIAGDMLELFSNRLIKSTIHRVSPLCPERYSVVFFLGLHFNQEIKQFHLIEDGPLTFGDHVIGMSARSAPHLSGIIGEIEKDHGFRIPTKNPLRRLIK